MFVWDNPIQGRISRIWQEWQQQHFKEIGYRWKTSNWSGVIVENNLQLAHYQWIYQNIFINYKEEDGLHQYKRAEIKYECYQRNN